MQVLNGEIKELGGFSVRRLLPQAICESIGPWVFFDHMGPADFSPGQGINVRPHPHINLATVTYLFEGEVLHRDALGSHQLVTPGAVNLMVAGSGLVHSEREQPAFHAQPHRQHGLQLWLALPTKDEEIAPAFYHYPADTIPSVSVQGVDCRVLIGSAYGVHSPVKYYSPTLYIESIIRQGQTLPLPEAAQLGVYIVDGEASYQQQRVTSGQLLSFQSGSAGDVLTAIADDTRLAIIGGAPLGKRYKFWNFISSRPARIEQAKADWLNQRFAKIPGDEAEFIPLP